LNNIDDSYRRTYDIIDETVVIFCIKQILSATDILKTYIFNFCKHVLNFT